MLSNFLLSQANEDYLTFDKPFELILGDGIPEMVSLSDGTRNTMVIVQDGVQPRPIAVSTPTR